VTARGARRIASTVGVVVLVALLVVALRRLDVARLVADLKHVRAAWLVCALLAYVAILPLWALEWRVLAPSGTGNTFRRMLGVVAMTSSTLNTTPFLVGEAAGALLLVTQIGLTRSAALSMTAMDQLLVGVAKLVVLTVAAFTLTLPTWMSAGVAALAIGVGVLLSACLTFAWHHERIALSAERLLPARVAPMIGRVGASLAPLRSVRRSSAAITLALAKKAVEVLAIYCAQHAFGVSLPIASCVLVLAALNLATLVPIVPANLGVYEAAVALIYTHLGLAPEQAVAMAVVQHACFFVALALPGYAWLLRADFSRSSAATS
jgi:uncharacterized protein (TIRG00374 family)